MKLIGVCLPHSWLSGDMPWQQVSCLPGLPILSWSWSTSFPGELFAGLKVPSTSSRSNWWIMKKSCFIVGCGKFSSLKGCSTFHSPESALKLKVWNLTTWDLHSGISVIVCSFNFHSLNSVPSYKAEVVTVWPLTGGYRLSDFHLWFSSIFRFSPTKRWHIDTVIKVLTTVSCTTCM